MKVMSDVPQAMILHICKVSSMYTLMILSECRSHHILCEHWIGLLGSLESTRKRTMVCSAMQSGKMSYFLVKSDEFENSYTPLYNIFLNPDYVAARSLCSHISNKMNKLK